MLYYQLFISIRLSHFATDSTYCTRKLKKSAFDIKEAPDQKTKLKKSGMHSFSESGKVGSYIWNFNRNLIKCTIEEKQKYYQRTIKWRKEEWKENTCK